MTSKPGVEETKENTEALMQSWGARGKTPRPGPGPNKVRLPSALAMHAVNVLGNGEWRSANITIDLNPVSASRPRVFRNGGVGYSKSYTKWRKEFHELFPKGSIERLGAGPFVMQIEHVKARPPTTKLLYPGGDLDNMDKAVMDGLQKAGAIDDDKDVVGLLSSKRWTLPGEAAHSTILILYVTDEQRKQFIKDKKFIAENRGG